VAYVFLPSTVLPEPRPNYKNSYQTAFDPPAQSVYRYTYDLETITADVPATRQAAEISDSEVDTCHTVVSGSPYAQHYFDGTVWVPRPRAISKVIKGNECAHKEAEWSELYGHVGMARCSRIGMGRDIRARVGGARHGSFVKDGVLSVWKERTDDNPEMQHEVTTCVGLYGGS
jgi:hypothetical protein